MIAGNRLLQRLGPVMRWAAQEDLIPVNFVPDIRKAPEQKRTRKLSDAEIRKIWTACGEDLGSREAAKNFGRMVRFLLVTAQRRDEAASLRHGHILDGVWRQTDNKSEPTAQPQAAAAGAGAGRAGRCARLRVRRQRRQDLRFLEIEDRARRGVSGVTDWRLHDLRRTAATRMQGLGIPNHIVQAVFNHALPGVGGVYLQDELEQQKADALATWATALTQDRRPRCGATGMKDDDDGENLRELLEWLGARC